MLRVEVSEAGQDPLPAVDIDDEIIVIGSATSARIRLPAQAARREHVRVAGGRWRALADVKVDGEPCDGGEIGGGVTLEVGGYHVRLAPAPAGAMAAPVQRTESLARELMRGLLGAGAQPTLEIERGPAAGAKRALAPPESVLVIGRGDEAGWIIADKDLSRAHAEIRRGWDGVRIVDLDSKNGTRVDGQRVTREGLGLRDGCVIELGPVVVRFRDPAEKHLQGDAPALQPLAAAERRRAAPAQPRRAAREQPRGSAIAPAPAPPRPSALPFYAALTIGVLAVGALAWILAG